MTTVKHTPGLFVSQSPVRQNEHKRWFKSVKDTKGFGGNILANAYGKTSEEAEDRAKLIAAAPELLEALKECLFLLNGYVVQYGHSPTLDKKIAAFKAAIKKATE